MARLGDSVCCCRDRGLGAEEQIIDNRGLGRYKALVRGKLFVLVIENKCVIVGEANCIPTQHT